MADLSQLLHSRVHWQLNGISDTARRLDTAPWTVLTGADRQAFPDTWQAESPTLSLTPAFPGSWVLNDICVQVAQGKLQTTPASDLREALIAVNDSVNVERKAPTMGLNIDADIMDAIGYAGFAPLRAAWIDRLYRSNGRHAIIILHYQANDDTDDVLQQDVEAAAARLFQQEYQSASVVAETVSDTRNARLFARRLAAMGVLHQRSEVVRPRQLADLFALIGKADVLMTGGSSLYADAIVTGVPVDTWRTPQPDTVAISDAYSHYCKHGDRMRVCGEQYRALRESVQGSRQINCLANRVSHLANLLAVLSGQEPVQFGRLSQGWIIDPAPPKPQPNWRQQSQQQLHRQFRLAEKFRESPSRFMADSRHTWLRRLNGWRQ